MKAISVRPGIGGLRSYLIALVILSGCPGQPPADGGVVDSGIPDRGVPDQSSVDASSGACTPQSDLAMERPDLLGLTTNFSAPVSFSYPDGQGLFATADFNGDGALDILSIGKSGIWLLLNRGCRTFSGPIQIFPGGFAIEVTDVLLTADFNGDGRADFAFKIPFTSGALGGIEYSLSRPDGSFTAPISLGNPFGDPFNVDAFATGDINRDGKADLLLGNASLNDSNLMVKMIDGRVMTLFGDGKGGFAAPVPSLIACAPDAMVTADIDGDGWTDVVCSEGAILFNDQHGNLGPAYSMFGDLQRSYVTPLVADINGDGLPDIFGAVAPPFDGPPYGWNLSLNQGHRMFAEPTLLEAPYPYAAAIGDLNGDGRPDFITSDDSRYNMAVRMNLGGGKFAPPVEIRPPGGGVAGGILVADMDGDHKPDIIINDGISKIQVFFNNWR